MRRKLVPASLKKPYRYVRVLFTFSVVSLLWVFFRAHSVTDAFYILSRIFNPGDWATFIMERGRWQVLLLGQSMEEFLNALLAVGFMLLVHAVQRHDGMRHMFSQKNIVLRWVMYILMVLLIMNLGMVVEIPFIYAEF
jgi:hypothetical protein